MEEYSAYVGLDVHKETIKEECGNRPLAFPNDRGEWDNIYSILYETFPVCAAAGGGVNDKRTIPW